MAGDARADGEICAEIEEALGDFRVDGFEMSQGMKIGVRRISGF